MVAKKQFDWRTYSRPPRLLTPEQEESLAGGVLSPLRELATSDPLVRIDIRARSFNLYRHGANLARVAGDGPFVAELPAGEGSPPERVAVATPQEVETLVARLAEESARVDERWSAAERSRRDVVQTVADSNGGGDLFADEYLVVDLDYAYGQGRYDLVALHRTDGVTGPGAFANPQLAFVDVRCRGAALTGRTGLDAVAGELAEFAKAIGGSHLVRAKEEFVELVAQKVRLGLLPDEVELRGLGDELPELLVLFADYPIADAAHDAAIVALHDRLAARHYPTERLRFAQITQVPEAPDRSAALGPDDPMTYRQFKEHRLRSRS